jgi:nucleotide-binding universal stress UspA family protein
MKTILVPTDFSKEADNALEVAASIARNTDANIVLLHIVEGIFEDTYSVSASGVPDDGMDKVFILKMIEKAGSTIKKKIAAMALEGINVKPVVKVGSVFKNISEIISEYKVDLIVMGTQGAGNLSKILSGSNTEKVTRLANALVLSVKEKAERYKLNNILLATNFKDDSVSLIEGIKELQGLFNADLNIVYVNTPGEFQEDLVTREKMKNYAEKYNLKNFKLHIVNSLSQEKGIILVGDEINADVIALSSHARKGLSNFFLRSLSQELVNYAHKPILTHSIKL